MQHFDSINLIFLKRSMQPPSFVLTPLWTYIQQSLELIDGRVIGVSLVWFPRLFHATPTQREAFELSYTGIHWMNLMKIFPRQDYLLSVEALRRPDKPQHKSKLTFQNLVRCRNPSTGNGTAHLDHGLALVPVASRPDDASPASDTPSGAP